MCFTYALGEQGGLPEVTFWADVEAYKMISRASPKAAISRAKAIFRAYQSLPNFSTRLSKEASGQQKPGSSAEVLEEAQLVAEELIAGVWLPRFRDQPYTGRLHPERSVPLGDDLVEPRRGATSQNIVGSSQTDSTTQELEHSSRPFSRFVRRT